MYDELNLFFPKPRGAMQFKMVWNAQLRRYVSAEAGNEGEVMEIDHLMDIGTRYDHLMALKDVWTAGVATIMGIKPEWRSAGDDIMLKHLDIAIALLDRQLDVLSKFDSKQYDLRKMMTDLPEIPAGEYEKTQQKLLTEKPPETLEKQ